MTGLGAAGRMARSFVDSKLTPLVMAASLGLGALALLVTPREEEPQIRVPMIDVMLGWPGASAAEVESRLIIPVERELYGLAGVEHVYSSAQAGGGLVTVRFEVGASYEESLVKVFERQAALQGLLPPGALPPSIELRSIHDVPFMSLTLWSATADAARLREIGAELLQELNAIAETTRGRLIGGRTRAVRVEPDLERMAAADVTWQDLVGALQRAGARGPAGTAVRDNLERRVETGTAWTSGEDVADVVVAARDGRPVFVRDVARVSDGPDEVTDAVFFFPGPALGGVPAGGEYPAVTLTLAKRPGANATDLALAVRERLEELRPHLIPADVHVEVTRDYGETADAKSDELVEHLLIATFSVVILISLAMGWRSGLVVGVAVPVTLALTLFIYFLVGYTLNRVTLFALIFSIGILVDDAIVVVENIERHLRMKPREPLTKVAVHAVDEVGNPTILATFTVIAAILPMAFVRGLMGPYMRPIPTGASAAMLFSLAVAFAVSPWAAVRFLRRHEGHEHGEEGAPEGRATRLYRRVMSRLVRSGGARGLFFLIVAGLLAGSMALVGLGLVKVKMLPFDNKSEFQVILDHPEGTPLEVTLETARRMSEWLTRQPEVRDVELYAGTAAPVNFNGLVRHYFLRRSPSGADLQVNLADKHDRDEQSHAIARRLRPGLVEIARERGAEVKVVEIPPGPPVLDTLVAEIYGPDADSREELAHEVRRLFESTEGVVDVTDTLAAERARLVLEADALEAGIKGVPQAAVVDALASSGSGAVVGFLEQPRAREPVPVRVRLSAADRAGPERRGQLRVPSTGGPVALAELTRARVLPEPQPRVRKDLMPVVYVMGDLAGTRESPVYALAELERLLDGLEQERGESIPRYAIRAPETAERPALKWDGEWQITWEVFRDLGIAFAVVLGLIAVLVVGWFESFTVPLAILLPIPLSLVGVLPGHLAFGAFFTATSMIGFIAGAGIIVRNSIILVDFIELKLREGMPLEDAVVEAGVVRFRPMLLTAAAVVVGAFVILFDPIFQGLAISLMMGEVAATFLSRLAVPVVYYMIARRGRADALHAAGAEGAES